MSVTTHDEPAIAPAPVPGSLEARVAERREKLEQQTTELFDVPGFEDIFQVELRVVGGKRQHAILTEHERVHDEYQKLIRSGADMLLAATVAFHAVVDAEGNTQPAEGATWKALARAAHPDLPDTVKGRVALLRLLGENGVFDLVAAWRTWMKTRGQKINRELEKDF
jgi:hypothetical protein